MIDESMIEKLKNRYHDIHPLIFHRSMEHARSGGDLFDIVSDLAERLEHGEEVYPLIWDEEKHRWAKTDDIFQTKTFVEKQSK